MTLKIAGSISAALVFAACGGGEPRSAEAQVSGAAAAAPAAIACEVAQSGRPLPREVRESSGLARSARDSELFWTHNDAGNEPELFAVDESGRLVQRVRVAGATLVDWEDIETAPCERGSCLFVGDIGDNDGDRERITIYRVPEPAAGSTESAPAAALHARFPDGPRDAESLFADRSGNLFIVTKGRAEEIALYRYPAPQRPGEVVVLEHVRTLFPEPQHDDDRVTSATTSPDGRWTGIRSYRTLFLYPTQVLTSSGGAEPLTADLSGLGETQGESVVLANDGAVWVSSEAAGDAAQPIWSQLKCTLPEL